MAGTSRRPSSELGPDLPSPPVPKKSKLAETGSEKLLKTARTEDQTDSGRIADRDLIRPIERVLEDSRTEYPARRRPEVVEVSTKTVAGCSREEQFGGFVSIARDIKPCQREDEEEEEEDDDDDDERRGRVGEETVRMGVGQGLVTGPGVSGTSKQRIETERGVQIQTSLLGEHALYQELSLIGNGAYGTVYKAKDLNSGQVVALKKVRVPLTEDGLPTSTLREIATLKQLERFEHPHIVRLLDVCQGNYLHLPSEDGRSERVDRGLTLWLVFEHVERDLASYISSSPRTGIPPHVIRQMSKEILKGVEFLHSHRIIHRDLKPQNLLVSRDGRIKIADFGLAKTYDFEMRLTSVVVTQWYRAPEVLLGCSYATPVDIWSVGCILAELSILEPLFPGTSEGDQLDRIFQIIGTPSQEEWPENVSLSWTAFPRRQPKPLRSIIPDLNEQGLDLIKGLLTFDPHIRLTASQALRHLYLADPGDS